MPLDTRNPNPDLNCHCSTFSFRHPAVHTAPPDVPSYDKAPEPDLKPDPNLNPNQIVTIMLLDTTFCGLIRSSFLEAFNGDWGGIYPTPKS